MNKLLYRVIFNKTRGMLMVVADIVRSGRAGHPRRERRKASAIRQVSITPLRFALYLAAGLVSLPQHAAIRVDRNAPDNQQPTIDVTANGLPQINIQTPNEHGVSRNQYTQFDVGSRGAILNNSHNITRTQLAGQITGNPWLAKQEARIILNEVNSRNLSKLNGFIEVAGRRAEVIIANPYGITCNGCGFINAEQAMLLAGQVRMDGGKLKGFDVDDGRINITGNGLNTHDADYTRLIARAVNVNARVQTKGHLKMTTGRNETDVNGRVTRVKKQDEESRPDFALDVAVLGGMYANKIMLEGTEFGVGVRNAGELGAMAGELSLSVNGQLINSGQLSGQQDLQLAVKGDMHHTGSLAAGGNLELSVPGTLHNEGMIRGGRDVRLTAAVIENARQGTLAAGSDNQGTAGKQGNLLLRASGELKMQGRHLATGNLKATGDRIDLGDSQTQGRTVTLNARQGDVRTANAVVRGSDSVKVRTHTLLDNTGGLIQADDGTLLLDTKQVINRNTFLPGKGLGARVLTITAHKVDNTQGALCATDSLTAKIHQKLENKDGLVASQGRLQIEGDKLDVHNHQGTLIAARDLGLTTSSLGGDGKIQSQGSLDIRLKQDFHNTDRVQASGYLILSTKGQMVNSGILTGQQRLDLDASHIINTAEGHISAQEVHLSASKRLNNTGLIDGGLTHLQASMLSNTGTGRIFGDHVAIAVDMLDNLKHKSQAGVIAARDRLDIGAGTINNCDHALITSQGDIALGAILDTLFQATGQGQTLNNHGAAVDAGRHLIIDMKKVSNINRKLVTQIVQVEKSPYHEAVLRGHNRRYHWKQVDTRYHNKYGVHDAVMPDGNRSDEFYEYNYLRTVNETQVKSSEPGKILARKNLTFNTEHVENYDSQIVAGGMLGGNTGTLDNHATKGERVTTDRGRQTYWYAKKEKKKLGGTKTSQGKNDAHYRPPPVILTLDLKTLAWQENTAPQHNSIDTGMRQTPGISLASSELLKGNSPLPPAGQTYTLTLPPEVINGQTITPFISTVSPKIQLPDNSLFSLHPGTDSQYLVETDPRFVNKKQWLTSDYMQTALTTHHDNTHKRLGDGYYEQQLIRDQLIQLTSQRYTRNHTEDETQYLALMNNGIAFGKQYQLQPGVALTPEQMALLTADIVWLADRNVRLADGSIQKVRIPQVYAKLHENDLSGDGVLLSGKEVALTARSTLRNRGTISSLDATHLVAQNLANSGAISSNSVTLQVGENIDNTGGQIRGGDSVALLAGQNLNSQTTTRTDGTRRWTDRQAGVYVNQADGRLTLNALNNITLSGSTIENSGQDGSTLLKAGNDLRLETVNTLQTEISDFDSDNWRHLTQQTDTGSRITTQGALTLSAGRNITATAADVSADAALVVQAQRDIRLDAGHATIHLSEHSKQSSSGLLSNMSVETHDEVHERQPVHSTVSGDTIDMQSGRDLRVSGSNIVSTQDINLNVRRDLSVTTTAGSREEIHFRQEKDSGLMGSGGIGFTVGKASQEMTTNQSSDLNYGSMVGSNEGNVILKAGHQATVHGSDLVAGKNMSLSSNTVNITAAENSHTSLTQIEQKQSGLTVALSGTVGSALNTAASTLQQASKESDSRLSALQNTKAALSGIQAVQAYRYDNAQTEAANAKNTDAGLKEGDKGAAEGATNTIGISASYGSQSSKSETRTESHQAQGTWIMSGKNLSVVASGQKPGARSGDIAITGSMLKAGQDLSLAASRDINLHSALNTESTTSKNSSKGGNVGIGIGVGSGGYGISISAGINAGKGHENGNGLTHVNTTLDAGQGLSLACGRDTTLKGAQSRGEKITADVGRNMTLQSQQDSNDYDARQQNFSAGGSFTFGSMTASGYLSATQDKINSNFNSVKDQTGLFAGKGGYDVKVKEHTRLDGAVLDSRAETDNNYLDTGTLSWSDIHNQADFSAEHIGVSLSSGGPVGKDLLTNMAGGLLLGGNNSDHAEGTTRAGVSEGTLIIRDSARQQQNIARLNRDTAHANEGSISPIFNREKEQKRLRQAQLVSEIGLQVLDIYHTQEAMKATQAATKLLSDSEKWQAQQHQAQETLNKEHSKNPLVDNGPQAVKERAWQQAYDIALTQQSAQLGGNVRMGVHAVVGALQMLAGDDIKAALAQGAAPYLAAQVKHITTDGKPQDKLSNQEKLNNVVAHALLGGVIAELSYGNALAGATGAVAGELAAPAIALALYGTNDSDTLTSQQKETLSSLATLASGIAAGVSSDSSAGAVVGAQAGKNALENNYLTPKEARQLDNELQDCKASGGDCNKVVEKYINISNKNSKELMEACTGGGVACVTWQELIQGATNVANDAHPSQIRLDEKLKDPTAAALVNYLNSTDLRFLQDNITQGDRILSIINDPTSWPIAVMGGKAIISNGFYKGKEQLMVVGISSASNAAIQYGATGEIKLSDVIGAGVIGAITAGKGYNPTVTWNAAGGYYQAKMSGDDPFIAALLSKAGASTGYATGYVLKMPFDSKFNPISKQYEWIPTGVWTITRPVPRNPLPSIIGNVSDSAASNTVQDKLKGFGGKP